MTNPNDQDVNETVQTKRVAIIGIREMAQFIEQVLSGWLPAYPQGVYLPNRLDPVITSPHGCFFEIAIPATTAEAMTGSSSYRYQYPPVHSLGDVLNAPWDIVDGSEARSIVLSHRETKAASLTPDLPVYGIKIARDIIHNYVYSKLAYAKIGELTIEDIIEPYLHEQAKSIKDIKNHPSLEKVAHAIYDHFLDTLKRVKTFMRDNEYLMHELTQSNPTELHLEQKGDFRIYDWTRRMADETWK